MNCFSKIEVYAHINLAKEIEGDKFFKIESMNQLGSDSFCFSLWVREVAHRDPLEDTVYETAKGSEDMENIVWYPMSETLTECLEEEGFRVMSEDEAELTVIDFRGGNAMPLREI